MLYNNKNFLKDLENHNKFKNIFNILFDEDTICFEIMIADISRDLCKILLNNAEFLSAEYYPSTKEYIVDYNLDILREAFCYFDEVYEDYDTEEFENIIKLVLKEAQKRGAFSCYAENDFLYHIIYKVDEIKNWVRYFQEDSEMYNRLLDFSYFIFSGDRKFFEENCGS